VVLSRGKGLEPNCDTSVSGLSFHLVHPEDGDCSECLNVGRASRLDVGEPWKPDTHLLQVAKTNVRLKSAVVVNIYCSTLIVLHVIW
jgi:hypothetical protein